MNKRGGNEVYDRYYLTLCRILKERGMIMGNIERSGLMKFLLSNMLYTDLTQQEIENKLLSYSQEVLVKALATYMCSNSNNLKEMLEEVNKQEEQRMEQLRHSEGYIECVDMLLKYYGLPPYDKNNYVTGTRDYAQDILSKYSEDILLVAERDIMKRYQVDGIRRRTLQYVREGID